MIGQTISHYQIIEKIGEGGMGVVYRAHDKKLERHVAIKFLSASHAVTEQDKARFIHEARAASALEHPHICTIHAIDETPDGQMFLVMPCYDGMPLNKKIEDKPLAIDEAIDIAIQIADGLQAAHEKGIVHRDIKSSNIFITSKGQVKVMDFGLARSAGMTQVTKTGTTVGTVPYMSPEQAQGSKVDHRTDIWSLGVILYEMITGRMPFRSDYSEAIVYSILNEEPDPPTSLRSDVPMELERIIKKMMQKNCNNRYQSISDVLVDLKSLRIELESDGRLKTKENNKKILNKTTGDHKHPSSAEYIIGNLLKNKHTTSLAIGVLLILSIGFIYGVYTVIRPARMVPPPVVSFNQLTSQSGVEIFPDISPDGKFIVYSKRVDGNYHIFIQRAERGDPINITKNSGADNIHPAFSPDGEMIAFRSSRQGGGIYLMGSTGESVRRLTDFGFNPAWSPDGRSIAIGTENVNNPYHRSASSELWIVSVETGEARMIYERDAVWPDWSPNGKFIAFWGLSPGTGDRALWLIPSEGGIPYRITDDPYVNWNPRWSGDGKYIYYSSDRGGSMNIWRIPVSERSGKVRGDHEPITTPARWAGQINLARDGSRIIYTALNRPRNIYRLPFDPVRGHVSGNPVPLTYGTRTLNQPDPSPDNEWIVYRSEGLKENIFVMRTDGSVLRQLTDDLHKNRGPSWSHDGKRVVFYSNRGDRYEIWEINADGSGLRQLSATMGEIPWHPRWFPDGKRIAFRNQTGTYIIDVSQPLDAQISIPLPPLGNEGGGDDQFFFMNSLSNDGTLMAGIRTHIDGSLIPGIFIFSMEDERYTKLTDIGNNPMLLNDNQRLIFYLDHKFYLYDIPSKNRHELYQFPAEQSVDGIMKISYDNTSIYYSSGLDEADIWLATLK